MLVSQRTRAGISGIGRRHGSTKEECTVTKGIFSGWWVVRAITLRRWREMIVVELLLTNNNYCSVPSDACTFSLCLNGHYFLRNTACFILCMSCKPQKHQYFLRNSYTRANRSIVVVTLLHTNLMWNWLFFLRSCYFRWHKFTFAESPGSYSFWLGRRGLMLSHFYTRN